MVENISNKLVWSTVALATGLSTILLIGHLFSPSDLFQAAHPACQKHPLQPRNLNGGMAIIGEDNTYPEEAPRRRAQVDGFSIDRTEVTNRQFAAFVEATNYVTDAERIQPGFNVPGGAVFTVPTIDNPSWWRFVEGAQWRHPEGPISSIENRADEPVV